MYPVYKSISFVKGGSIFGSTRYHLIVPGTAYPAAIVRFFDPSPLCYFAVSQYFRGN